MRALLPTCALSCASFCAMRFLCCSAACSFSYSSVSRFVLKNWKSAMAGIFPTRVGPLRSDLPVLSACQTGTGEGTEGSWSAKRQPCGLVARSFTLPDKYCCSTLCSQPPHQAVSRSGRSAAYLSGEEHHNINPCLTCPSYKQTQIQGCCIRTNTPKHCQAFPSAMHGKRVCTAAAAPTCL